MSAFKKLTFLKVLSTVAWADGQMTHSELNLLKSFFRKFGLSHAQYQELRHYLEAPVSKKEQKQLFEQLVAELDSPRDREEILQALETMAQKGGKQGKEESELIQEFIATLKKSTFTTRTLGKFRNLLNRTLFQHARDKDPELLNYFKRQVFQKIQLKSDRHGHRITLPEDQMYFICLLGTLLASVAHVDDHLDAAEKKSLKEVLEDRFDFSGKELEILIEVVEELSRQGFDFHEVMTQVNQLLTYNERCDLIDCFFAIATADGEISHEESEQIRRITKAMHIPHQHFKQSKIRALEQIR
ncbi:MAG: hypothetical protein GWM98_26415 [Nitrospinaceae bacterium]|nr:hypothetical protein [Nitrospinaceae bacterium]NIR57358.1 hypothetical protein [Nitrospinaceae bacterium]NIS87810.1 hypothetical protein [Nitrospinaceae bacterium]NIT84680.1 hypothetical protein [Nitrospinaceae bacterium]NIU46859.1 hypothetical protein [Nitrospinaceae bacterium]